MHFRELLVLRFLLVYLLACLSGISYSFDFSDQGSPLRVLRQPFPDAAAEGAIGICSFNIQWLGHWKKKKTRVLAELVQNCDALVVQELVAPPIDTEVRLADGSVRFFPKDDEAHQFFVDLQVYGFDGVMLAGEDTGPNQVHNYSTASEWPVIFYKSSRVEPAYDLPNGYIDEQIVSHPIFARVPHAFGMRSVADGVPGVDFVVISVHMRPMGRKGEMVRYAQAKRVAEFQSIALWIEEQRAFHPSMEEDFFIMGDMNVEDADEMGAFLGNVPESLLPYIREVQGEVAHAFQQILDLGGYYSMNSYGRRLFGTNLTQDKPFDHIVFEPDRTTLLVDQRLFMIDLANTLGLKNYSRKIDFIRDYSDHNPLELLVKLTPDEDGY